MRQSVGVEILKSENGVPYAIHMKADFTAEHERGINDLRRLINTPGDDVDGIERYKMGHDENTLTRVERLTTFFVKSSKLHPQDEPKPITRKISCLRFGLDDVDIRKFKSWLLHATDTELSGGFDDQSFEVLAYTPEARAFLDDLHSSLLKGDFSLHMGSSSNPFSRGGLNISIPSRVPQAELDMIQKQHVDHRHLLEAAQATGIKDRIVSRRSQPGGNQYNFFALVPSLINNSFFRDGFEVKTDYNVKFFLNPYGSKAKSGWYTVEELDAWIDDSGPVLGEPTATTLALR